MWASEDGTMVKFLYVGNEVTANKILNTKTYRHKKIQKITQQIGDKYVFDLFYGSRNEYYCDQCTIKIRSLCI